MSDHTGIEWTDATWNVVIGCDKVSPGCDNCYAIRTAHRMTANPNPKVSTVYAGTEADGDWTGRVNLIAHRLALPLRWAKPRRIFVNAQSDLFHDQVPDEFIARVFAVMALAPQHTFQILTKRHGRMRSLLNSERFDELFAEALYTTEHPRGEEPAEPIGSAPGPLPNVWLGVSVENQEWADIRVPALLETPAAVRFLSCEPLLGPVSLFANTKIDTGTLVDWVIVGGESGPGARPMHPEWARGLRRECQDYGIAFHFKQWGEWAPSRGRAREQYLMWPRGSYVLDVPDVPRTPPGWVNVERVGKKAAGRELDGRTWDEFPKEVA